MTVTTDKKADPADETSDESAGCDRIRRVDEPQQNRRGRPMQIADTDERDEQTAVAGRRRAARRLRSPSSSLPHLPVSGVLGWMLWQERQVTRPGQQAQQAAVAYAQILTSIDSNKVDENFNQVLDGATGEFKDMYSQSSAQLRQLLIDNKASAHGVVVESAIQSASKDKVVVLLFVDQSVSNTTVPDPRIDRSRIKMTMEFVDGRWRASKVALP